MIINVFRAIFARMSGADTMLKQEQKVVAQAKQRGAPIDIDAGFERVMQRYPRIMARLGA